MKNLQKIIANLEQEDIGAKIAQKRDLDGLGARFGRGLGRVLGRVWRLWGVLRPFLVVILSCLYLGWSSIGLLEASGLDFGSILGGLERIFSGFWQRFLRILGDSALF